MSRDYTPREKWFVNKSTLTEDDPHGLYLSNILYKFNGVEQWAFTEEELEDRRKHKPLAVLAGDIYKKIKELLPEDKFEALNKQLGELVAADEENKSLEAFPEEILTWYFNKNRHHYHEPNDEEFFEYVESLVTQ